MNIDMSQIITAEEKAKKAAQKRVTAVKAEAQRRIEEIAPGRCRRCHGWA